MYVMRMRQIEDVLTKGSLQWKRSRGRQSETMLDRLASYHGGISVWEIIGFT